MVPLIRRAESCAPSVVPPHRRAEGRAPPAVALDPRAEGSAPPLDPAGPGPGFRAALAAMLLLAACSHGPRGVSARPEAGARSSGELLGEGMASFYGESLRGRPTATGEPFDPDALTAAHRTLPFGTCLRVENAATGRSVRVRINDRGPYAKGRIIDLSESAARALDLLRLGVGRVRLFRC